MPINIVCKICGREFYVPPKRKDTAKYCSEKCKGESYKTIFKEGDRYGKLTIIKEVEGYRDKSQLHRMVLCQCDCGKTVVTRLSGVRFGTTTSCGCYKLKVNRECRNRLTHGIRKHPLYNIWRGIKSRCYNKKDAGYKFYGERGVRMCDDWLNNPKAFYDWAILNGWKKGLHLDKDKLAPGGIGKLYCPELCCFLTPKENTRCTRWTKLSVEKAEEIRTLHATGKYKSKDLAVTYGVNPTTISAILCRRNWV